MGARKMVKTYEWCEALLEALPSGYHEDRVLQEAAEGVRHAVEALMQAIERRTFQRVRERIESRP